MHCPDLLFPGPNIPMVTREPSLATESPTFGYAHRGGGFLGGFSGKESTCQCRRCKRCGFDPCARKIPWCSLLLGFSPSRLHLFSSSPGRFFGLLLRFFLPGGAGLLLHFPALLRPSALGLHGGAAPVSAPLGAPPCYCSALRGPSGSGPCWLTPTGRPGAIIPLAGLAPQVQFAMVRRPAESWRPIQCFLSV